MHRFMRGLENEASEHVYELLMDTKHRVTGVYVVGKGSVDNCIADAKDIFKAVLITNSSAFALVHNHPSGVVEPSTEDRTLSDRILDGAGILGLDFLDFLIVGDGSYYSFHEQGLLKR